MKSFGIKNFGDPRPLFCTFIIRSCEDCPQHDGQRSCVCSLGVSATKLLCYFNAVCTNLTLTRYFFIRIFFCDASLIYQRAWAFEAATRHLWRSITVFLGDHAPDFLHQYLTLFQICCTRWELRKTLHMSKRMSLFYFQSLDATGVNWSSQSSR